MAKLPFVAEARPLPLAPGDTVVLSSHVHFHGGDAISPNDLYDFGGGGLRVVRDGEGVQLEWNEADGAGCVAAHLPSPCLVPKADSLAHARLLTPTELIGTMQGDLDVEIHAAPHLALPGNPLAPSGSPPWPLKVAGLLGALVLLLFVVRALVRRGPLSHVLRAARAARKATKGDPTLLPLRSRIDDLVLHARLLDRTRRAWEKQHAKIDPDALAVGLPAEREEAARLEGDLERAREDMNRVASALRLLALQARAGRVRGDSADPVAALTVELALRDEALLEASR